MVRRLTRLLYLDAQVVFQPQVVLGTLRFLLLFTGKALVFGSCAAEMNSSLSVLWLHNR